MIRPLPSRRRSALLLPGLLLGLALLPARAENSAEPAYTVRQPERAFGHHIGSTLEQRLRLSDSAGEIAAPDWPVDGRVDTWLSRWPVARMRDDQGANWLVLTYQIVNSPTTSLQASLPEVTLESTNGTRVHIPAWPFTFGPLTPSADTALATAASEPPAADATAVGTPDTPAYEAIPVSTALGDMQPDRPAPMVDSSALQARWQLAMLAWGTSLLAWLVWWGWRLHRDRVRLPFAAARRSLQALRPSQRNSAPEAWTAMHASFNRLAGHTATRDSVPQMIEQASWLRPFEARIREFYSSSAARFFEKPPREVPFELNALCRDLEAAERRQAR